MSRATVRIGKAALAALALTGAFAQPAAALEQHSFANTQTQGDKSITQQGFWQIQRTGATTHVAFECVVNASPDPINLAIDACYLEGRNGTRYVATSVGGTLGPATATGWAVTSIVDQQHRICVKSNAFFQSENTHMTATLACSSFQ
jgi:hypothetical protein